jgi:dCTP deaminase
VARTGSSCSTRASSCSARRFERVALADDLVGRLDGKSSLGRLGLLIHSTAGFIDPGFDGHITLELSNVASLPITLYPGMRIGQISFWP